MTKDKGQMTKDKKGLGTKLLKHQTSIRPAKAEAVREYVLDLRVTGCIRHVVEIAIRIRDLIVNGWRKFTFLDRKHRKDRLYPSGCTECVPRDRLGRAHGKT